MTETITLSPLPASAPGAAFRVAIVVSRYNNEITDKLEAGALAELARRRPGNGRAVVIPASGSFELPTLAAAAARSGKFDAVVALGCVIKGETRHDHFISTAVANELARAGVETGIAVAFGVLTVETDEQAEARAGGKMGNKGIEAMAAAIETAEMLQAIKALR